MKYGNTSPTKVYNKVLKQKQFSTGTVMLVEMNPNLFAVLLYNNDEIVSSCCMTVFNGCKNRVKRNVMKHLNRVYNNTKDKLSKHIKIYEI